MNKNEFHNLDDLVVTDVGEIKINNPHNVSIHSINEYGVKYLDLYITAENIKTKEEVPLVIRIRGQSFEFLDPTSNIYSDTDSNPMTHYINQS